MPPPLRPPTPALFTCETQDSCFEFDLTQFAVPEGERESSLGEKAIVWVSWQRRPDPDGILSDVLWRVPFCLWDPVATGGSLRSPRLSVRGCGQRQVRRHGSG